jgi:hypothetical protein
MVDESTMTPEPRLFIDLFHLFDMKNPKLSTSAGGGLSVSLI